MGTVLLTGANSSLGLPAVEYLLTTYPSYTAILTVRNPSAEDANTAKLRTIISKFPNAKVEIRKLDLSSLEEVSSFAANLHSELSASKLPRLASIICNAMSWTLDAPVKYSSDGYELSMAVSHLAHFSLVLRLLGDVDMQRGRIVFLSSDNHWPGKAGFEVYPPVITQNLDELVHPKPDKKGEQVGRGFQRYGLSKLVAIMVMYELNRRLKKTRGLENIRALAVDPGALLNSRAFTQPDVPSSWRVMIGVANRLQPLVHYFHPKMRRSEDGARDVVDLAVSEAFTGKEGYFSGRKEAESSPDSLDEGVQGRLWVWSLEVCGVGKGDTVLEV